MSIKPQILITDCGFNPSMFNTLTVYEYILDKKI